MESDEFMKKTYLSTIRAELWKPKNKKAPLNGAQKIFPSLPFYFTTLSE